MGLLADTFMARLVTYLQAHDPTRVLVGGLPDFFIERVAATWNGPYQLYLVSNAIPAGQLPANVERCRADDLTAERQRGWAALVTADESRRIQESIRSTGAGTVRELWATGFPWRPCELPGARWADLRDDFIDRLGLSGIRKEMADCVDQFREELRGEVYAPQRFFTALDSLNQSGISYDDVCFHLGFPAHKVGRTLRKRTDKESVLVLLDNFVDSFKEDGADEALAQFSDIAHTRYSADSTARAAIESALKFFADEFRRIGPAEAENPVRAWRTVFANNRGHWETLSADALATLLVSDSEKPTFTFEITNGPGVQLFTVGENEIIVRDGNVSGAGITATFQFGQSLLQQAGAANPAWRLFARVNRVGLQLINPVPTSAGPHPVVVRLAKEGKQGIRFSVGPESSSDRALSKVSTLWECCEDYPLVLAASHAKTRAGKRKRSKDEQGNTRYEIEQDFTLPAQGRVALHGFIFGVLGDLRVLGPGESAARILAGLTPIPNSACQRFTLNVDVVEGTEIAFFWTDGGNVPHRAVVTFDFKGEAGPREDSMSGIMVRAHGGTSAKLLKDQLATIRKGGKVSPSELSLKETGKPIARWEMEQQNATHGWWPILAAGGVEVGDQKLQPNPHGYFSFSSSLKLNEQANAWKSAVESATPIAPLPPEVTAYVNARSNVLEALGQQFHLAEGESIEEINVARKAVIGLLDKQILANYVTAYTALLTAAKGTVFPAAWRWIAWSVDSVLIFTTDATGPTAHLLGPLHPITLSRLFFLQQCLGARLLDDEPSALAQVFAQMQPLALGHVIDAQLQPTASIAFPTGELHWLWLFHQQEPSKLPSAELANWLRTCGLDPQTGPLGVDAEILPQTLRQYVLAYPSHQTIRLTLEDCSQRTFEVLRDELSPEEGDDLTDDRLLMKLPGGVSVYDPVTQVKRTTDGELLSYDGDLPLRWHHANPPAALTIDLATLSRSNRVDFQSKDRGGACSRSVPTARRGLVDFSVSGLEVSSFLDDPGTGSDLESSLVALIRTFEPSNQQLSWGTSLSTTAKPKANWTLCSAAQVDPRLFIEYVRANPGTALWTFRLFSLSEDRVPEFGRGHFLIARVSHSLSSGLQTQLSGTGLSVTPNELLTELAEAGLTLGDEFLRTGRTAEGALGQYLVERLLWQPSGSSSPLPHWTIDAQGGLQSAGFILQIDPFNRALEALSIRAEEIYSGDSSSRLRSDLVSLHLQFCGDELWIRPVVLESKFLKAGQTNIESALAQAAATASQFDHLLEFCVHDATKPHEAYWAQPERLLLAELVHLGLRLSRGSFTGQVEAWHRFERAVLSRILSGSFRRDNAQAVAIIHHPGPTQNNLMTNQPHALVSFADSNAARSGSVPDEYKSIQQTLADMVRHVCGKQIFLPTPISVPPTAVTVNIATPAPEVKPAFAAPAPPAPSPSPANVTTNVKAVEDSTGIAQAHAAFDAAFADFIGNMKAIEKLRDDIVDALIKQPPHLPSAYLLTGNPSTGKTTLANKVARLLGVTFVKLVGTNVRSEADLVEQVDNAFKVADKSPHVIQSGSQGIPEHEYPECLIFIDEIHLVKGRAQEGLLTLTEPKDRYVRLKDRICRFPRATYMAATTRDSEIDKALRTRFGNPIHLENYTVEEVAKMLFVKKAEWSEWPEEIRVGLARLSRCVPREAERMAQKLERKLTVSREPLTLQSALEKLRLEEGLDRNGLDQVCWQMLRHLAKQTRAVGREALAQEMGGADEEKLVSEIIPALRSLKLVEQVAGGQKITDAGRNYLRNEAPPA